MEERKKNSSELAGELKRIYADPEGRLPDFTRLDGKPGSRFRSLLFGGLVAGLVAAGAVWAGILAFSRGTGFTGERVALSIETQPALTSGGTEDIVIHYRNGERIPLAQASLEVALPPGFAMTGSDPIAAKEGAWQIGAIPPGSEGKITIHGDVRRELGAALTFTATLNYKPADFNSDFQKIASHTVAVSGSVLTMSATGPAEVVPGDEAAFVFSYENRSDRDLAHMRLAVAPPDGFLFASADPQTDPDIAMQWTFPKIAAHARGTLTVKGTFSAAARGPKALVARMGFVDDQNALVTIAQTEADTEALKSNLDLALIVNGSDTAAPVDFGDTLFFTVRYENSSDVTLRDVVLTTQLPTEPVGAVLDWISLKDDLQGKHSGSTLTWTKKELPALASLAPGDKGEIEFSVPLTRKPLQDSPAHAYVVHAKASAVVGKAGRASGTRQVDTAVFDIRLRSDVSLEASGRYYTEDGVPLGSGPMPPRVGQKTVYRVFWTVRNSLHELTNLTISTVLPEGVKWTGTERQVEAGTLSFDETGRQATWRLNRLPVSVPSVVVSFDVELTPGAEDIGKILDLTGTNRLEAYDKDVDAVLLLNAGPVGTDLIGDETAGGKGAVEE